MENEWSLNVGKILLVDDDEKTLSLLRIILEGAGNVVFSTSNPLEAGKMAIEKKVDVVLLDVRMPEKSGIEVCQEIRQARPNLPIIMVTGATDTETCRQTLNSGANDFLCKPIDAGTVLIRVRNAINISHLQQRLKTQSEQFQQVLSVLKRINRDVRHLSESSPGATEEKHKKKVAEILADYGFAADDDEISLP